MRNHKMLTALTALTFVTGTALAAAPNGTTAQRQAPNQTQQRAGQTVTVAYYQGNPLNGGQLIKTTTVTAQRGAQLFQNAPQGATYALITTPRGKQVINLKTAQTRTQDQGRGAPDQNARPDAQRGGNQSQQNGLRGPGDEAARTQNSVNGQRGDRDGAPQVGRDGSALGGLLRGASSVTFYTADPLKGGKATQTIQLSGTGASQEAALTQAAKNAGFAVIERNGEQVVVDLSAAPTFSGRAGDTAPQGPQRR